MSFGKTSKSYEPKRTIAILTTKQDDQTENTQRFLQSRDWKVETVSGKLGRALPICTALEPDYLFVSLELLSGQNFHDLYSALKKSFRTILFSEKLLMRSLQRLQELDTPDVLTTALSGPNIERLIHKLERDESTIPIPSLVSDRLDDLAYVDINRLARATTKVMEKICQANEAPKKYLRTQATYHCFSVQTARLCGYIVVAAAGDTKLDFTLRLKRHLSETLTLGHDFIRIGDSHSVDIHDVEFERLAGHMGEFFNKGFHLGNEIAVSFFRAPSVDAAVADSPLNGYLRTSLNEISDRAPLEFDVYVYMPLNKKFVLYRRAGSSIEAEQKKALEFHGINEVHFKRAAAEALSRHKARSFINSLVWNYRDEITQLTVA